MLAGEFPVLASDEADQLEADRDEDDHVT